MGQDLDLYQVYQQVMACGGSEAVTEQKKWKLVADSLNLDHLPTSASNSMKVCVHVGGFGSELLALYFANPFPLPYCLRTCRPSPSLK